jgi:hypothetical protein
MTDNKDIAVLAKKVYELSVLPVRSSTPASGRRCSSSTRSTARRPPRASTRPTPTRSARWGAAIRRRAFSPACTPSGTCAPTTASRRPPATPSSRPSQTRARDLRARLATLQFIAPADRPPLEDLARALISDAFNGAKGEAREQYLDAARSRGPTGFASPGRSCSREGGPPPVMILIDNQGGDPRRRHLRRPRPTTPIGTPQLGERRPHLERRLPARQPARPALHGRPRPPPARSSRPPARSPRAPTRPRRASPPCSNGPRMSSRASAPSVPPRSCSPR